MATRPNIILPAGVWVDVNAALNAQSGFPTVTVGTALNIKLESSSHVRLCEKATQPADGDGFRRITNIDTPYTVDNNVGLWAFSVGSDSTVNVEVA
jgi:hypothetical protein